MQTVICRMDSKVSKVAQYRTHGLYSLPGSFVHGIFQARVLEWVAIPFSRGSSLLYSTRNYIHYPVTNLKEKEKTNFSWFFQKVHRGYHVAS